VLLGDSGLLLCSGGVFFLVSSRSVSLLVTTTMGWYFLWGPFRGYISLLASTMDDKLEWPKYMSVQQESTLYPLFSKLLVSLRKFISLTEIMMLHCAFFFFGKEFV
jgi:hypothetical protein